MTYKILALGGGGTKGILHLGALKVLEEQDLLKNFEGIYGCSVGCLYATALAFGLTIEQIERMSTKFSSIDNFTKLSLHELQTSLQKKGLFEMNMFEEFILEIFDSEGLDLRKKIISDSEIPLFICSTNLTKHVPTVFSGNIPILKAIRASCCIPIIFCPQIINNSVYIDGGYLTNIILNFIPIEKRERTLSISIIHNDPKITPHSIEKLSHIDFLYGLYKISCIYQRKKNINKNNIDLYYNLPSGISDVGEKERGEMILKGSELTRRFFSETSF